MATLQAATTSTSAIGSDPQAARQLCESYCFGTLDWEVTEDGELTIWGMTTSRCTWRKKATSRTTRAAS